MKEKKTFKAINFDLSTKELKLHYEKSRRNAYREIEKFLENNRFSHRQWSGYISDVKMSTMEIVELNEKMWETFPWMEKCAKRMDVTNVEKKFDLIKLHKELVKAREQAKTEVQTRTKEKENQNTMGMAEWKTSMLNDKQNNNVEKK